MTTPFRSLPWLLCCLLAGCGDPPAPPEPPPRGLPPEHRPAADERILSIDGVDITYGEVQPYVEYFDRIDPKASVQVKVRQALDNLTLPLRFAQREFAAERAAQLADARQLCGVAGNAEELLQKAGDRAIRQQLPLGMLDLPVALFLSDRLKLGAASQPIEVVQGYCVVGALDLQAGAVAGDDAIDCVQVRFFTFPDREAWSAWVLQLHARLADKVSWVHPDFRYALPDWLKLP